MKLTLFNDINGKPSIKRVFGSLGILVSLFMAIASIWHVNVSISLVITLFTGSTALLGVSIIEKFKNINTNETIN